MGLSLSGFCVVVLFTVCCFVEVMVTQLCWRSRSLHQFVCLISVRNWCTKVFLWLTLQKQPWCGERWMQKLGSCCWAILGLWTQSYQTFLLYAYSRPAYSFACFTCCQSYRYDFCLASSFSFISPQSSSNKNKKSGVCILWVVNESFEMNVWLQCDHCNWLGG